MDRIGSSWRDDIADLAGVVLAGDELGDGIHGAGTVEGDDGGDVLNALGLQSYADAGHAGGFHLEHTVGFAVREHFVGLRVVLRDVIQGEVRLPGLHHFHGIVQHRQVPQAQEVHFQQAQLLQCGHDILADHGCRRFSPGVHIRTPASRVMTTPAAWVEAWRGIPSSALAVSMSFFTCSSAVIERRCSCLD